MANLKAASSDRFVQLVFGLPVNQRVEFALRHAIEESAHFVFLSRNLKFAAAIQQVTDPPGHVESFGGVAHRPAKSDALNVSFVENLERNHGDPHDSTGVSLVRIDETETASLAFDQIDRNKVLAAVRRREPGRRFFLVIVAFRRHLFSGLIIDADGNFFRRFHGRSGEPILVSRVKIYRYQGVVMWLQDAAPMPSRILKPSFENAPATSSASLRART